MMKVKVSGPLLSEVIPEEQAQNLDLTHRIDASLRDGDLYIHIHLGWKAFLAFGLIVVQTVYTFLTSTVNVV